MRTLVWSFIMSLAPLSAASDFARSNDQLKEFATCVGQLSAQMEYEWMFDGPGSEITEARRAAMIELVDALRTNDDGRQILAWRIAAKQAHFALLTRATFNEDEEDAAWAKRTAQLRTANCSGLLLS